MSLDPRNFAPQEFFTRVAAQSISPISARRWLSSILHEGTATPDEWGQAEMLPKRFLASLTPLPRLSLVAHQTSAIDGFQKLGFRTEDNHVIETVLIPLEKPGAVSLCLSSQVGCPMACVFCATGRMATTRNLQTWEIIDQFIQAREIVREQGRRVTGVVFMGMGEPFLNYARVLAAAELLSFPLKSPVSSKAITISTVGLVPEIERFTAESRRFRLSISLGAATDEKRKLLVPIAARTPVADVMRAARGYATKQRTRVNLAYVCVGGMNTTVEDAKSLGELIGDTPVRLDLIDVNDTLGGMKPPSAEELRQFRDALRVHLRQPVVRRYSGGGDIRAACGTLQGSLIPAVPDTSTSTYHGELGVHGGS